MFWFLMVLIAACLAYLLFAAKHYQISLSEALSRIERLENQAEKMENGVAKERARGRQMAELLRVIRETESELKNEITLTSAQAKDAQKRESELEMDMYKKEFKRNKQRGY